MLTFPPHLTALQAALRRTAPIVRCPAVSSDYLKALLRAACAQGSLETVDVFEDGYGLSRLTPTGVLARRAAHETTAAAYLLRLAQEFDPEAAQGTWCLWLPLTAEQLGSTELRAALGVWCRRRSGASRRFVLLATDTALSGDLGEWVQSVELVSPRRDDAGLGYLAALLCHHHPPLQTQDDRQKRRVSERLMTRVQGLDAWSMAAAVYEAQSALVEPSPPRDLTAWEEGMMRALQDAKAGRLHRAVGLELQTLDGFNSDQLAGMERYKRHLDYMSALFHNREACVRDKIALPKGVLLVGLPGCGKSLAAKLTASRLSLPLLRLEVGALMGRHLGESEQNLRRALEVASSAAPCVLWIDELDKALSGLGGQEGSGTGARLLGALLTWMQEQEQGVYVFATANRVTGLPPELLRRGRFDELWKVLLPTDAERKAILLQKLRERGVQWTEAELTEAVKTTEGYAGADLEALVREAQVRAFCTMAERLSGAVFAAAQAQFTPLSKQFEGEIKDEIARLERHGFRDVSGAEALPPEVAMARRALGSSDLERLVSLARSLRFHFGDNEGVGFTLEIGPSGKGEVCGGWVASGEPMSAASQSVVLRAEGTRLVFAEEVDFLGDHFVHVVSEGGRLLVCGRSGVRVCERTRFEGPPARCGFEQVGNRRSYRVGMVQFAMVYCPPGEFWMGSAEGNYDERPRHVARVSRGFWIGESLVTQTLWSEIMKSNPSIFKGIDLPVESVSWHEAIKFCCELSHALGLEPLYGFHGSTASRIVANASGFRLPSEVEWEYAAKAAAEFIYAGSDSVDSVAWYADNSAQRSRPVKSKEPNAWGVYDMSGNVEEWCEEPYVADYHARLSGRVDRLMYGGSTRCSRGGSWMHSADGVRVARRKAVPSTACLPNVGFRLVQSAT